MAELKPQAKGYPIKLVRDRTAEIVNPSGVPGSLWYGPTTGDRGPALRRKLGEEITEYLEELGMDELLDAVAVVEGLANYHGVTMRDLSRIVYEKSYAPRPIGTAFEEYVRFPGVENLADVLGACLTEGERDYSLEGLVEAATKDPRGGFLTGQMMYGCHPEFDEREITT